MIGCFSDSSISGRAIPDDTKLIDPLMTNEMCLHHCLSLPIKYRYAATQAGTTCRCGLETAQYGQYGELGVNNCDSECKGSGILNGNLCGGNLRNTVWDLRDLAGM